MHETTFQNSMPGAFDQIRERQVKVSHGSGLTRVLLICGLIAGPFYLVVGMVQALTRPGFDLLRYDLSLLANGPLGWIQITNLPGADQPSRDTVDASSLDQQDQVERDWRSPAMRSVTMRRAS